MLKSILMVWVLAQNLGATQHAYEDYLGYTVVETGVMPGELAGSDRTPGAHRTTLRDADAA